MPVTVQVITKNVYRCKCRNCGHVWDALLKPARCARCKARSWNGEDHRRINPYKNTPEGSRIPTGKQPPQPRAKDLLATLQAARETLAMLVADNPCNHKGKPCAPGLDQCAGADRAVLTALELHIAQLELVAGRAKP